MDCLAELPAARVALPALAPASQAVLALLAGLLQRQRRRCRAANTTMSFCLSRTAALEQVAASASARSAMGHRRARTATWTATPTNHESRTTHDERRAMNDESRSTPDDRRPTNDELRTAIDYRRSTLDDR